MDELTVYGCVNYIGGGNQKQATNCSLLLVSQIWLLQWIMMFDCDCCGHYDNDAIEVITSD